MADQGWIFVGGSGTKQGDVYPDSTLYGTPLIWASKPGTSRPGSGSIGMSGRGTIQSGTVRHTFPAVTSLTLHFDGADESSPDGYDAEGNSYWYDENYLTYPCVIDTALSVAGGSCLRMDASDSTFGEEAGCRLQCDEAYFDFNNDAYTISLYVYFSATNQRLQLYAGGYPEFTLSSWNGASTIEWGYDPPYHQWSLSKSYADGAIVGRWIHVVIEKTGDLAGPNGTYTLTIDDVLEDSFYVDPLDEWGGWNAEIPASWDFSVYGTGGYVYIDEFQINGVIVGTSAQDNPGTGDPSGPIEFPNGPAINTGDFTVEGRFFIDGLCEKTTGEGDTRYSLIGQYDGTLWEPDEGVEPNWWALEFIVEDDYTSYFQFAVWDKSSNSYIGKATFAVTPDWADNFVAGIKENQDAGFTHVAAVRYGDELRLFVGGQYLGTSAITDWDSSTSSIQVNGQTGRIDNLAHSVVYIEELQILNYAKYWSSFTVDSVPFSQNPGICLFPRMYPILINGNPGDLRANLSFAPRMTTDMTCNTRQIWAYGLALTPRFSPTTLIYDNKAHQGINMVLPALKFDGTGYESCRGILTIQLPSLLFDGEGRDEIRGSMNVTLPMLEIDALGVVGAVGQMNITIPALKLGSTSGVNETGVLSIELPMFTFAFGNVYGAVGTLDITLPSLRPDITGLLSAEGTLSISIPMLKLSMALSPQNYVVMVMNIKNSGLTDFKNYDFNSLCHFQGKNLGANGTAIYDLDLGSTDDNELIECNFKIGLLDLEQKFKKKLRQAWISHKSDGDLMMTITYADGTAYEYDVIGYSEDEDGVRVKFGKGIRSKYVSIDVKNVDGSTIDLDVIKLHFDKVGVR